MKTELNKLGNKNIVSHNNSDTFIGPPEFKDTSFETESDKFDWGGFLDGVVENGFEVLDRYINGGQPQTGVVTTPVTKNSDNTGLYIGIGALLLLIILLLVIKK